MAKVKLNWDEHKKAGAYGLQMEDGTRYTANRRGVVEIDRQDHLKALNKQGVVDFATNMPTGFGDAADEEKDPSSWCPKCKHRGWPWNFKTGCPKCKGPMISYADVKTEEEVPSGRIGY